MPRNKAKTSDYKRSDNKMSKAALQTPAVRHRIAMASDKVLRECGIARPKTKAKA